ncbi:hypothetical protein [Streptomyces resistomycificus]|uniref:Uncharacterized protein n=1 Tax=Streptomyces resistomycificus TaxID=67356 RepID=A0A0L8LRW7_9ACTN|nr:hypothetical protein [Streptomyces resistomycificus]KOG40850.1 hypothetical protein ADK37_07895 [Streptomyces resistomycificus]KUN99186.1 hypothetical protein AQJ84_12175 [Streptomyces resistomycificus]
MSYDLAVWEGARPADDRTAGRVFTDLYDRYLDGGPEEPASERVEAYVAALLERWCDVTEDEEGTAPWSAGPLINGASGPLVYFGMSWGMAEEASAYAAGLADSMGLVCFDVQQDRLRP